MRISAIMAAYNCERYIAQAIESVVEQTRRPDEIIVVDDGSTDATRDVLRTFARHVHVILQKQNGGVARALNIAIAASTGDTLAFLDCDDLWSSDKLMIQSSALVNEPELEAVFGLIQQFASPDLHPQDAQTRIIPNSPQPGISKVTLLIRRDAFDRIGWFDEKLKASDFVDWYSRASLLGLRWRMVDRVVALRRHHSENSGRLRRAEQHDEILLALKGLLDMRRQN
jgi:glycosyltransferase involved in cell wall biosynthesis